MSLIATEKVRPLIDELVESRGSRRQLAEEVAASGRLSVETAERRIYAIQSGEIDHVREDIVDAILCGADALYLWHLHNEYEGAVVASRQKPGPKSQIPHEKVQAAHILYRSGMSSFELGELMYERYGYKNGESCARSLVKRFRELGYARRTRSEGGFARYRNKTCVGCGASPDERTRGCLACNKRHFKRKLRSKESYKPPVCAGCGCLHSERTTGCTSCTTRHYWRRHRGNPESPSVELPEQHCGGCGTHFDFRTRGCQQCRSRHYARRKRAAASSRQGLGSLPTAPQGSGTASGGMTIEREAA